MLSYFMVHLHENIIVKISRVEYIIALAPPLALAP